MIKYNRREGEQWRVIMANIQVKCRMCRLLLISGNDIIDTHGHSVQDIADLLTCKNLESGNAQLSQVFLSEDLSPQWLADFIVESSYTQGKIACPKCQGRLGSFDFVKSKRRCPCGKAVLPPVHFLRDRVDVIDTNHKIQISTPPADRLLLLSNKGQAAPAVESLPFDTTMMSSHFDSNDFTGLCSKVSASASDDSLCGDTSVLDSINRNPDVVDKLCKSATESCEDVASENVAQPRIWDVEEQRHCVDQTNLQDSNCAENENRDTSAEDEAVACLTPLGMQPPVLFTVPVSACARGLSTDQTPSHNAASGSTVNKDKATPPIQNSDPADTVDRTSVQAVQDPRQTGVCDGKYMHRRIPGVHSITRNSMSESEMRIAGRLTVSSVLQQDTSMMLSKRDRRRLRKQEEEEIAEAIAELTNPFEVLQSVQQDFVPDASQVPANSLMGNGQSCSRDTCRDDSKEISLLEKKTLKETIEQQRAREAAIMQADDVPLELTCAMCLDIMLNPHTTLPCNHDFCATCLRRLALNTPVNTKCPLCRETIVRCIPNSNLARVLHKQYPVHLKAKKQQEKKIYPRNCPLPGTDGPASFLYRFKPRQRIFPGRFGPSRRKFFFMLFCVLVVMAFSTFGMTLCRFVLAHVAELFDAVLEKLTGEKLWSEFMGLESRIVTVSTVFVLYLVCACMVRFLRLFQQIENRER